MVNLPQKFLYLKFIKYKIKGMKKTIFLASCMLGLIANAQEKINSSELEKIAREAQQKYDEAKVYEELYLKPTHSFPEEVSYEGVNALGVHEYLSVDSRTQINSMNVDYLYNNTIPGVSVTGAGMMAYIWDGGDIRTTHEEFGGRVTNIQNTGSGSHSTPVAGVIVAQGLLENAQGIAYEANLKGYNYTNNIPEMTTESNSPENADHMISNHSYESLTA